MRFTLLFCLSLLSLSTMAEIKVLTSIKPLQLILTSLTEGEFQAEALLGAGASPHHYSLKPHDIQRLQQADLFLWVGPELEPYFAKPLQQLPNLQSLPLLAYVANEAEHEQHKDEHEHEHEQHSVSHEEHHHSGLNPHFWLGIEESKKAAEAITQQLINLEPSKKQVREKQLTQFIETLSMTDAAIRQQLSSVNKQGYFVFHDAYGYFEQRYHLNHLGAFTLNPQRQPGAKQLAEIKQKLISQKAVCVFSEPQFKPAIVESIVRGTKAKLGSLDPMATNIQMSPKAYFEYLQDLTNNVETCLKQ